MIQLTKRDSNIIKSLASYGVLTTRAIGIFHGFTSVRYTYRRLLLLRKYEYIKSWVSRDIEHTLFGSGKNSMFDEECYFLTSKLYHEYLVGEVLSYLVFTKLSELKNIQTERDYQYVNGDITNELIPDITLVNNNVAIELELTRKSRSRISRKVKFYSKKYSQQYWILSDDDVQIGNILKDLVLKSGIRNLKVIYLSEILNFLSKFENDLSNKNNVEDTIFNIDSSMYKKYYDEEQLDIRAILRGE